MKNKIKFLVLLTILSAKLIGQNTTILPKKTDPNKIPKEIKYTGNVKNAVSWNDKLGENIVLLTETGEFTTKNSDSEDSRDAALYAYHYIVSGKNAALNWKIYDFIHDCPVEIEANFVKNTFSITDLNKDGIAEIWVMYTTVCHGDVSPSTMKIIMHENNEKFSMRGENKVKVEEKRYLGGKYTFDKAFNEGPAAFREYAKKLWQKHVNKVWQ
ncbi:hypothetical protein D0809_15360 [Flavobacterium circumlabens]|uniref:Uncharacterized protein n=1 Tax=Flavobacterium circumlabens TaxID=2133765 RepID=A0A4Y7UB63_9FLAO|nr:hypothetical protein [Flavobacterium circumlabens]TCN56509.1 hypothetical protein EV142_105288 [Flavobacterium circumlabens]TEB43534.1 hypothetical protein D0809_15360 [Flavobacterium circumlabens]